MNKFIWIIVLIIVIIGVVLVSSKRTSEVIIEDQEISQMMTEEMPVLDTEMIEMDEEKAMMMKEMVYDYEGDLIDVTDGETIRETNTGGNASGFGKAGFKDSVYSLFVTFEDLPDPEGSNFYEGWVVRKIPFRFMSTGKVEKVDGIYTNTYMSERDLTDHNFYVLTIEPDDGDPAPAEHILEGTLVKK